MNNTWVAALLTPSGMSAIAVIGVRGAAAINRLASRLTLRRATSLQHLEVHVIAVADFRHGDGATEEVVVFRTAIDSLEIHCHGGRVAADSILGTITALDGTVITASQWAHQTEICPLRADALFALSQVSTPQPTRILLDQSRGALRSEIEQVLKELSEQDNLSAHARLVELVGRARIGQRLVSGFQVALLGRPNVGKSSLLNALLGFGRAIVLDEPGTTRDVLAAKAAFDGWPVMLQDLAGVRASNDPVEAEGVRRAKQAAKDADLVLLITDASRTWTDEDSELYSTYRDALVVHNKSDLPAAGGERPPGAFLSAQTGAGLPELQSAMLQRLLCPKIAPGAAVPFTEPQTKALTRAAAFAKSSQRDRASQELLQLLASSA